MSSVSLDDLKSDLMENPLASVPVEKLMLKMGIPMILSMALQAVYNIVDSAFVSNMAENGEFALNALTLAFFDNCAGGRSCYKYHS